MEIDTEALVMEVSCRPCCLFELEKEKRREEFLSKPKLGPSTKFEVKCGEAEECRQTLRLQFLSLENLQMEIGRYAQWKYIIINMNIVSVPCRKNAIT